MTIIIIQENSLWLTGMTPKSNSYPDTNLPLINQLSVDPL